MKPDSANDIVLRLRRAGYEAYLVGGCVRDMVMAIEPADYDIATSAAPEQIMRVFPHTQPVGVQFGVVLVIHHGHPFEVATFRSDDGYVDGRRPTGVTFTDARTDVLRRDFTINGLLYDPEAKTVIDFVGGQADIERRVVRAIGDARQRFAEDKLRLLRAIRFGARLGYSIEPETWDAVCRMAPTIGQVSAERIREEVFRILSEGRPGLGYRLLHESGLLEAVLPEVQWNSHLQECLNLLTRGIESDFGFAVLLHEVPLEQLEAIVERFRLSTAEARHVQALVRGLPQFSSLRTAPLHVVKRFMRQTRFDDHLELARICAKAAGRSLEDHEFVARLWRSWAPNEISPELFLTGSDLRAIGFRPGPAFKEMLTRAEDEQLDGRLTSKEAAIRFIRERFHP